MFSLTIQDVSTGITEVVDVYRFHTLIKIRKLKPNSARSKLSVDGSAGRLPTNFMAPIERASPNIRSESPWMRGRGI